MKTGERVFRNAIILILQSAFALFISLLINGYIAKTLGPSDYGKFVFAFSFAGLFGILTDLGFYGWSVKEIARERNRTAQVLGDLTIIRTALSLIVFVLISLLINVLGYPPSTRGAVYIAGISVILLTPHITNAWIIFEAHEKVKYEGTSNVLSRIVVGMLSVYLMFEGYGIIALSLAYMSGAIAQILYCCWILKKKFALPHVELSVRKYFAEMKSAIPFALFGFFYVLYYEIDKTMLSVMAGDRAVGLYNAATTITYKGTLISGAIGTAILPTMIARYRDSRERLGELCEIIIPNLLIVGLAIAVICTVFAKEIIQIIYRSDEYERSIQTLQIIIWMVPMEFASHMLRFALISSDRQAIATMAAGFGVAFNVFLNLLLIGPLKQDGAAMATLAAEFVILVFQFYYFSNRVSKLRIVVKVGSTLISSGVFFVLLYEFRKIIGNYSLIPALIGFFLIGNYLGCLKRRDLQSLGMSSFIRFRVQKPVS